MNIDCLLSDVFQQAFNKAGLVNEPVVLQPARNPQFGDYQVNGIMAAAKKRREPPHTLAQRVIAYVQANHLIDNIQVAGPGFINLRIKGKFLNQWVNRALRSDRLEVSPNLKQETVVLDYSSPNLAKEMHVGHLRSTIIGDSLNRIYQFMGAKVIAQNHVGDWGTQFGMLVAFLMKEEQKNEQPMALADLEGFYRQAKQQFDTDEFFATKAREAVVQLQHYDPVILTYWQRFISISLKHVQAIYERLGVLLQPADIKGESEYNEELPEIVASLLEKGIAVEEEGTKLVYLTEYKDEEGKPEVFIIQKKDGGYLYSTTDLACLRDNLKRLQATRLIYVVDSRQSLYFKALFSVAKQAGWLPESVHAEHVAFGTMKGSDGKPFKTRQGDTIKLETLLDEAVLRAERLVTEKNPHLDNSQKQQIAKVVGLGAVKYADLSKNRLSDYLFQWDHMLSLEGNTAPYLQYAYARINSLLKKAEVSNKAWIVEYEYTEELEKRLAVLLLQLEGVLVQVTETNNPHYLANYLYQLTTVFSRFYEVCEVLKADTNTKLARLGLAALTGATLQRGLSLLGIDVVERL
ncbi:MAG: arginine--tRNA ligase [Neisseriaceae bacterium]